MWDPNRQDKCTNDYVIQYTRFIGGVFGIQSQYSHQLIVTAWSAASDLVLVALPIALVWPLQMEKRLKVIVCFLLSLGVVAAIGSLLAAYYLKGFFVEDFPCESHRCRRTQQRLMYLDAVTDLVIWAKITTWLVLISTCMAPTYPLVKIWILKARSTGSGQPRKGHSGYSNGFIQLHTPPQATNSSYVRPEDCQKPANVRQAGVKEEDIDNVERMYLGR